MPVARGGSSMGSRGARSFDEVSRSDLRARGSISTSEVRVGGSGLSCASWAVGPARARSGPGVLPCAPAPPAAAVP